MAETTNPLDPFWLLITVSFELGLGIAAYFASVFLIPKFRAKSNEIECYAWRKTFPNRPIAWLLGLPYAKGERQTIIVRRNMPENILWWTPYKFAIGAAWFIAFSILAQLLTAVSLKAPTSLDNIIYDLIYARADGKADGAHIFSYVGIPIIIVLTAWRFKDIWLGYLVGGLLVAVHEIFWTSLYYLAYWPYINFDSLTNLFKDFASFYPMLFLLLFAFMRYRPQKLGVNAFKVPFLVYGLYLLLWFFLPKLLLGYEYYLPVTTLNLWNDELVRTIWKQTIYWGTPLVDSLEVGSWVLLFALMALIVVKTKAELPKI